MLNFLVLYIAVESIPTGQLIGFFITLVGTVCAIVFGYSALKDRKLGIKKEKKSSDKDEGVKVGTFITQLDNISSSVAITNDKLDKMCVKQDGFSLQTVRELATLEGNIRVVDDKASSAHKRLDAVDKKVETIEDHLRSKGQYDVSDLPPKNEGGVPK